MRGAWLALLSALVTAGVHATSVQPPAEFLRRPQQAAGTQSLAPPPATLEPLGPRPPPTGTDDKNLASSYLLEGVEAALKATGIPRSPGKPGPRQLHGPELEAMKLALDELRGGDPSCVLAGDLQYTGLLNETAESVLRGLPPWPQRAAEHDDTKPVRIAYLVQVSSPKKLSLVRRTFKRLYNADDVFLYTVDQALMHAADVEEALAHAVEGEEALPRNVHVRETTHAEFFFYPRVEVVLAGVESALELEEPWDVLIHLSESGYPVHRQEWIHRALEQHRHTSFVETVPYCEPKKARAKAAAKAAPKAAAKATPKPLSPERARAKEAAKQLVRVARKGTRPTAAPVRALTAVQFPVPQGAAAKEAAPQTKEVVKAQETKKDTKGAADDTGRHWLLGHAPKDATQAKEVATAQETKETKAPATTKPEGAAKKPAGRPRWWFWAKAQPVATCGTSATPVDHAPGFPLQAMQKRGFKFAHGEEWNVLTRDLCEYVTQADLADYKKLMSMRWGADELFWATLVSNIPRFPPGAAQPASMWFKRWQGHGSSPHSPDLLQWPHHTPELFEAVPTVLFARKLQLPESQTTVDMLDELADKEPLPRPGTADFQPPTAPRFAEC